ncbi:714_t:CDS:1 [Cetraspora pellucida]|uniref:714_t:CDS:1 n=1 Tax=Cetraspora pellucida TaxID=1433469 RepID=A0A9N9I7U3_9GLOM|nr:714_t:CDS:1 [Cetraspora pellucida]
MFMASLYLCFAIGIWRCRSWCIASGICRYRSWCVASGIRRRFCVVVFGVFITGVARRY